MNFRLTPVTEPALERASLQKGSLNAWITAYPA
jgi:hypothetical protein